MKLVLAPSFNFIINFFLIQFIIDYYIIFHNLSIILYYFSISLDIYHINSDPKKFPKMHSRIEKSNVLATPKVIIFAMQC